MEIGIIRNETHDVQTATDELIDSLAQSNPRLSRPSGYRRSSMDGHRGVETRLDNVSDATGRRETMFYVIAVAEAESGDYQPVFRKMVGSIRLND